jgi:hypothetical protein
MRKGLYVLGLVLGFVFVCGFLRAQEETPLPFLDDFEDAASIDNITFYCGGPPSEVDVDKYCDKVANEISAKNAHGGKKSLKIEFVLKEGEYNYWLRSNLSIPISENTIFSGYLLPVELPEGIAISLGYLLSFPVAGPDGTPTGGNAPINMITKPSTTWKLQKAKMFQKAKAMLNIVVAKDSPKDMTGVTMTGYYIHIGGKFSGQKIVCYIDDVSVENTPPITK